MFSDLLCFPLLSALKSLTSIQIVLTRDKETGLITSYREYWDQSVNDVLKTAKFGKKA